MNSGGIDGSGGGNRIEPVTVELDEFDGVDKHTLDRNGRFVSLNVRKAENAVSLLKGKKGKQLQERQDKCQTALHERRVKLLKSTDAKAVGNQLDREQYKSRGEKASTVSCEDLDSSIDRISKLSESEEVGARITATGELIPKGSSEKETVPNKKVVSSTKFKAQVQKDLTTFLKNAIRSSQTSHALVTLQDKANKAREDGKINEDQHQALTKAISSRYKKLIATLPAQLKKIESECQKGKMSAHAAQIEKLEAVHELVLGLSMTDTDLLRSKAALLEQTAMEAYVTSTDCLSPHESDLRTTRKDLEQSRADLKELLQPVLEKTSPSKVTERIVTVTKRTAENHAKLEEQLAAIPKLRKEMDAIEKKMLSHVQDRSRVTSELVVQERRIRGLQASLSAERSQSFDSKLLRRFDLNYQIKRHELRKELVQARKSALSLSRQREQLENSISSGKKQHTLLHNDFVMRSTLHSKSMEAVEDPEGILKMSWDTSPVEDQLATVPNGSLSVADTALARQYFKSLTAKPEALKNLATEFVQLVSEQSATATDAKGAPALSCHDALLVIDQAAKDSKPDASDIHEEARKTRNYKGIGYFSFQPQSTSAKKSEAPGQQTSDSTIAKAKVVRTAEEAVAEAVRENSVRVGDETASVDDEVYDDEDEFYEPLNDLLEGTTQNLTSNKNIDFTDDHGREVKEHFDSKLKVSADLESGLKELLFLFEDLMEKNWSFKDAFSSVQAGSKVLVDSKDEDQAWDAAINHLHEVNETRVKKDPQTDSGFASAEGAFQDDVDVQNTLTGAADKLGQLGDDIPPQTRIPTDFSGDNDIRPEQDVS